MRRPRLKLYHSGRSKGGFFVVAKGVWGERRLLTAKRLNKLGLLFGIIGVVIMFYYGPPQPSFTEGWSIDAEDGTVIDDSGKTVAQHDIEIKAQLKRFKVMSHIGMVFVGLGFISQLAALNLPEPTSEKSFS